MHRFALLFVFLASAAGLRAWDGEGQTTAEAGYASRSVFRGVEHAGNSAQALLELRRSGFRGGVRLNRPLASGEPGEADLSAGYVFNAAVPLTIEAAATQFFFSAAPAGATRHSTEAGLVATWKWREGIVPGLAYHRDFRLKADTVEASLGYEVPLTKLGAFLELKFYAGWRSADDVRPDATGPRIGDAYRYWGADARLPYRVGEHTTLTMGAHFAGAENQARAWSPIGQGGGVRGWVGFALNFDF